MTVNELMELNDVMAELHKRLREDDDMIKYDRQFRVVGELVNNMEDDNMFKVGDKVKIVDTIGAENWYVGEAGVIVKIDDYDDHLTYNVSLDNGEQDWANVKDLQLLSEFEIGDYVEATESAASVYGVTTTGVGFIGKVINTRTDGEEIQVEVIDHEDDYFLGFEYWVESKHFKHSSIEPTEKLVLADLFAIYKDEENRDRVFEDDNGTIYVYDCEYGKILGDDVDLSDRMWTNDMFDRVITELNIKVMTKGEIEEELGYEIIIKED